MTNPVNVGGALNSVSALDLCSNSIDKNESVQQAMAFLQIILAQDNKERALERIESIRAQQAQNKAYTDTINALRSINYDFESYGDIPPLNKLGYHILATEVSLAEIARCKQGLNGATDKVIKIDSTVQQYMVSLGDFPGYEDIHRGNDDLHFMYELDGAAEAMRDRLDMLQNMSGILLLYGDKLLEAGIDFNQPISVDTLKNCVANLESNQKHMNAYIIQLMIFVQDFISQYDAFVQGSVSAIDGAIDILKTLDEKV